MFYNYGSAVLRAQGDTQRPLKFLLIAGILNVILNLFFVIVLKIDVAGVGLATAISQYLSAFLILKCLLSENWPFCLDIKNMTFDKEEFKGCTLSAIFGSVKCNLRNSIIKEDVVVNATSIFGGIDILVPEDVNVKISSTYIFGGVSDERKNTTKDAKHTIYINVTAMFGGVELK